jgi:hypothetical protein
MRREGAGPTVSRPAARPLFRVEGADAGRPRPYGAGVGPGFLYTPHGRKQSWGDSTMRTIIAAAVLSFAAGVAQAQDVGGTYQVNGTNFDGSTYKGTATIEVVTSTTCRIHWETGSTSDGICMRNQNALAAGYAFSNGKIGLVVYEIMPDGTLDGVWTVADQEGAGTEVLTPQ